MADKKALLTLFGGRSFLPTALTLMHEKPEIVVVISSKESHRDLHLLKQAIDKYQERHSFSCKLETPDGIDAFEVAEIQRVCESTVAQHPDMDWLFDVTGATSLMTLAAYEASKAYSKKFSRPVRCWYLNTAQTRVIPLLGEGCDEKIFNIDVDDYATAYSRDLVAGELEDQREYSQQHWLPFAQTLGKNPQFAALIKLVMSRITSRPGKQSPKLYIMKGLPAETYSLLEEAQQVGLLSQLSSNEGSTISFQLSYLQDKFLNGAWLEAYVWDVARKIWDEARGRALFDDCQWNQRVIDGNSRNELDVAVTYKAQLLIAECKTGEEESFSSDTLYKLDSVANVFGGRFVGRLLITSISRKTPSQEFLAQAKSRRIVVVTGEALPDIATTLKQEAIDPTFPRI
ncbi:MAG: Card1-like endonuclease domain-containing protein [Ktedonobacteraceae bacterium]